MRSSAEHEHEDYEEDEHALGRVHDGAYPHALPPPRGVGGDDDVGQGSGDRPRLVQVVEGQEHPVGDEVTPPEDAPHPRQQKPPEEQVLAQERDEDQLDDEHREPAPVPAEELLAAGGAQEQGKVVAGGSGDVEAEELPQAEEEDEEPAAGYEDSDEDVSEEE